MVVFLSLLGEVPAPLPTHPHLVHVGQACHSPSQSFSLRTQYPLSHRVSPGIFHWEHCEPADFSLTPSLLQVPGGFFNLGCQDGAGLSSLGVLGRLQSMSSREAAGVAPLTLVSP